MRGRSVDEYGTFEAVWPSQFDRGFHGHLRGAGLNLRARYYALALELSAGERGRLTKRHTDNPSVSLYLQGHYLFGRQTGIGAITS